jgi:signal transduction histidine kinase
LVVLDYQQQFLAEVSDVGTIYAEDRRRDEFITAIEKHDTVRDFRYRIRRRDGTLRWISVSARSLRAPSGELEAFEGSVIDVTDPMLVETAARTITSEPEPARALELFAEILRQIVPFAHLSVVVLEGEKLRRVVSVGELVDQFDEGGLVSLEGGPSAEAARTRRPVIVKNTEESRFMRDPDFARAGIGSYAVVPLMRGDEVFATLATAFDEKASPSPEMVHLLSAVAAAIAPGVRNLLLLEERQESIRRLEELDRLRRDFLAMLTHDLRSPLAVVLGMAELLATRPEKLEDAEKQEITASMLKSGRKIDRLVADIMDFSTLESGQLRCRIAPFAIDELVTSTVDELAGERGQGRFEIRRLGSTPPVLADRHRTWQVLSNLLANAVKFSGKDSPIIIEIGANGSFVAVAVIDEGKGIAPQDQERIFEKFYRSPGATEGEIAGLGLGLYISRSLVEAQGGEISVESAPGRGSSFKFTLPVALEDEDRLEEEA